MGVIRLQFTIIIYFILLQFYRFILKLLNFMVKIIHQGHIISWKNKHKFRDRNKHTELKLNGFWWMNEWWEKNTRLCNWISNWHFPHMRWRILFCSSYKNLFISWDDLYYRLHFNCINDFYLIIKKNVNFISMKIICQYV